MKVSNLPPSLSRFASLPSPRFPCLSFPHYSQEFTHQQHRRCIVVIIIIAQHQLVASHSVVLLLLTFTQQWIGAKYHQREAKEDEEGEAKPLERRAAS